MADLLHIVGPMLEKAGQLVLEYYLNATHATKADGTPVTEADLAAQAYLVEALTRHFPEDGIVAEENDVRREAGSGDRYWTLDPIDGTLPFVAGMPTWSIALGLIESGQPVEGYVYLPSTRDLFATANGVIRNGKPAYLTADRSLHMDSILLTHSRPHQKYALDPAFPGRTFGLGTATVHMSLVASGSAHLVLIGHDKVWDLAPGMAMLRQNGGVLRYLDGTPVQLATLLDGSPAPLPMVGGSAPLVEAFLVYLDYFAATESGRDHD